MTSKNPKACDGCNDGIFEGICPGCNGSGEGSYDKSTCTLCKGLGTEQSYCSCGRGKERRKEGIL